MLKSLQKNWQESLYRQYCVENGGVSLVGAESMCRQYDWFQPDIRVHMLPKQLNSMYDVLPVRFQAAAYSLVEHC